MRSLGVIVEPGIYKGIAYSIRSVGKDQWHWKIKPPLCVRGLKPLDGTIVGSSGKVVDLVKATIDAQIEPVSPAQPNWCAK